MKLTITQKAIAALCFVAISYALLNVSVRYANAGFGSFTQVYLRIGFGLLLTLIFFYKDINFKKITKTSRRDWYILFLMGTLGYGIAVDFVTLGVLHTNLFNAAVIGSTTPFFVYLFNIFILRKKFNSSLLFFLIVSFYGVCVLATSSFVPIITHFSLGDLYVLLFAIGSCFFILGRKFLSTHLNNSEIAVIIMTIAFLSSLLVALLTRQALDVKGFVNPTALFGVILGGVLNLTSTKLQNFGFHNLNAVLGSQLLLLQNVLAPVFGFVLFQETIAPIEFAGALIVLVGVWFYTKYSVE
jgi:drug/metabolite transporter (DMT)-like permease